MPNQIPLQDDVKFWSRQMMEHALFLNLMLEDGSLKTEARRLQHLWADTIDCNKDVRFPLQELILFKQEVLRLLNEGRWIGWTLPSFVEHILKEAVYFQDRITVGTSGQDDFNAFTMFVREHALVGPKLVDPKATGFDESAREAANSLMMLQQSCGAINDGCLNRANEIIGSVNQWVQTVPSNLNIINPVLTAHILRENNRGIQVNNILLGS